MGVTRRHFLNAVGAAGGYGAVYTTMLGLGLLNAPAAYAGPPALPKGNGTKIVILGAGIAGLVAAYEMRKAGYDVTVLEARDRVAGRVWTIRGGDRIVQRGQPDQIAPFTPGNYLNAGAGRIPGHHEGILSYAHALNVPMEVLVNSDRGTALDYQGKPIVFRQAVNDTRGRFSELLAKAVNKGALDEDFTAEDKQRLLAYLRRYGDLDPAFKFNGTSRSGFASEPGGYLHAPKNATPLELAAMLRANFWEGSLLFEDGIDMQAPMLQPVGGMDRIANAIYEQVKPAVHLNAEVQKISLRHDGVTIRYRDAGGARTLDAAYCICTIPLNVLSKIDANFSAPTKAAIKAVNYYNAIKLAWEAPRFWEREGIYGGIAFTDQPNAVVWYPSDKFGAPTGVLIGAYNFGPVKNMPYDQMTLAEREAVAKAVLERLHPGQSQYLKNPVTVSWARTKYSDGISVLWTPAQRANEYAQLCKGDGRVYFAGEHMSYLPAWQEGSVLSAHEAIALVGKRVAA